MNKFQCNILIMNKMCMKYMKLQLNKFILQSNFINFNTNITKLKCEVTEVSN